VSEKEKEIQKPQREPTPSPADSNRSLGASLILSNGWTILTGQNNKATSLLVTAQALVLCGLPYKKIKETHYQRFAKTPQGSLTMTITAQDPKYPIPYGRDRALLAWVTTKAIQGKSPVVQWKSTNEFMKTFNIDQGGKDYKLVWNSWQRLARASILLNYSTSDAGENVRSFPFFESTFVPGPPVMSGKVVDIRSRMLPGFCYYIELSNTLWEHLKKHPVPLSLELMKQFKNEPKAWDFAAFLSWRSFLCRMNVKVARIPWPDLVQQLGSCDKDQKQLRKSLKRVLKKVQIYWPELRAEFKVGGLLEIRPPFMGVLPVLESKK